MNAKRRAPLVFGDLQIEPLESCRVDRRTNRGLRVWWKEEPLARVTTHGPIDIPRAGLWAFAGLSGFELSTPLFGLAVERRGEAVYPPHFAHVHLLSGWDNLSVKLFGREFQIDNGKIATHLLGPSRYVKEVHKAEAVTFEVDCGGGEPVRFLCNVEIERRLRFRGKVVCEIQHFATIDLQPYGRAPAHGGKRGDGDCTWVLSTGLDRIGDPETPISESELEAMVKAATSAYVDHYARAIERHGPWSQPAIDDLDAPSQEAQIAAALAAIPMMGTWDEYTTEALKTWRPEAFSSPGAALTYALLGLKSETGEVAGVEKRMTRDGVSAADTTEALILELGDVCWYLAIARHEAEGQWIYTANDLYSFMIHNFFTKEDAAYLAWQVFPASGALPMVMSPTIQGGRGFDVKLLFRRNIEKLRSRAIRGKIKGKGDKR